jgi:hypothetical protein
MKKSLISRLDILMGSIILHSYYKTNTNNPLSFNSNLQNYGLATILVVTKAKASYFFVLKWGE